MSIHALTLGYGSVNLNSGAIKMSLQGNGSITNLPDEDSIYQVSYGNPYEHVYHSVLASMTENVRFNVDESLYGHELFATLNLFIDGYGHSLNNLVSHFIYSDQKVYLTEGYGGYRDKGVEQASWSGSQLNNFSSVFSVNIPIQFEGQSVSAIEFDLTTRLVLNSVSAITYGNYMNTANLQIDLPTGVTLSSSNSNFLSDQYIPDWYHGSSTSVPEPMTIIIMMIGLTHIFVFCRKSKSLSTI